PDNLAIGQTIVIVQPETLYIVQTGDTLQSIAEHYNVSTMELLRNNPYLSDREMLYVGETIVIKYQTDKTREIATIGYTFSYIEKSVLIKTLPFLTYLTIFNYRATSEGEIISRYDDTELIQLAKTYGAAPMMLVSTMSEEGIVNPEVTYNILNNPSVQISLIENALNIMRMKGFYGINIYTENITSETINSIAEYLQRASVIFHAEGYTIMITISPATDTDDSDVGFEKIDYSTLSKFVDAVIFASYDWARTYGYPSAIYPVNILRDLLDYMVHTIPPEKNFLGITSLGYDWALPYVPGATEATAITYNNAVQIAAENGVPILFNEPAQSAYFYYMDSDQVMHIVWIKDARSFDARASLVAEYNFQGLSIWTIMRFEAQMWFIINTRFYIERLLGID
ncbi:LysM peptidoglycan-binding domain-containing protein, partial [Lacrimispora sp.]|uniref:LysM peptidoglycan-binding domain-containing protein n=1 Tax=Lacrimispora sp. TaxID=2719234 RepID=UPI002FD8F3D3